MSYIIAVAGKGGTGKTTISALIVRLLKDKKGPTVLAVDADPNSNLGASLGTEMGQTVGEIIDEVASNPQIVPAGISKDRFIEYRVQTAVKECDGFDLLTMGRPEGPGCYCFANNILRNVIGNLIRDYDYIVIDNEAGLEHFSRRTTRDADILLVISDSTKVGLQAAGRINTLTKELKLKIKNKQLIINRKRQDPDAELIKQTGLDCIGGIPEDEAILKISLNGGSLLGLETGSQGLKQLQKIGGKIWQAK